jgi:hypothetical protein
VAGPSWRAARPGVGLLGIGGSSVAGLGLRRLDGLGVAPQQPACAVGVGAVIGGGDVQRAGSGAGGQLGVEVAAGARRVGEVVADVLCGVGDADGDVVIREEPRAGDDVARRWR